jgi:DedD protein
MKKDLGMRSDKAGSGDLNHDLKIRARRRLIGAITLVLTAVIVVPMLLDSEPRPLNQNIPIEIPSKNTPFTPKIEPVKSLASASPEPEGGKSEPVALETRPTQASAVASAPQAEPPKVEPPKVEPPKANTSPSGKYLIQVAAYSKDEQAQDWVKKLKAGGFQAYTEKITTSAGLRIRVRVGPYATQAEADKALALIKAQGATEARLVN